METQSVPRHAITTRVEALSAIAGPPISDALRQAIELHKGAAAAVTAYEAANPGQDPPEDLNDKRWATLDAVAKARCVSADELVEKLRYLHGVTKQLWGCQWKSYCHEIGVALDTFFATVA